MSSKEYSYTILSTHNGNIEIEDLQLIFPAAQAAPESFCLFSTNGVHGSRITIEQIEKKFQTHQPPFLLSLLIIQPKEITVVYGHVIIRNLEDITYLKKLRESSWDAIRQIGIRTPNVDKSL